MVELVQRLTCALLLTLLLPLSAWAASVYIDPSCANDGDGTADTPCAESPGGAGPYNVWSSATFTAGNSYLQKRGTTSTAQITIAASGNSATDRITLDAYGTGADPIINAPAAENGIYISGARSFITISDFEITGMAAGGDVMRRAVRLCTGSGTECTDIRLSSLTLHDIVDSATQESNGIWGYCSNCTFDDLTIYNIPSDGIWIANVGTFTITNSNIHDVATSGRVTGDCIQITGTGTRIVVQNNIFDHSSTEAKQAYLEQTGATSALITGNQFIMSTAQDQQSGASVAFANSASNAYIASNLIQGGWRGMTGGKDGSVLTGNVFRGAYSSLFVTADSSIAFTMTNNTFDGEDIASVIGINASGTSTTVQLHNNAFVNLATAVQKGGTVTFVDRNNLFYGNTANGSSYSPDASSILADPLFLDTENANYRTAGSSPARRAGISGYPCADVRGRACYPDSPDIGANSCGPGCPAGTRLPRN